MSDLIALFNFIPNYCPSCGEDIKPGGVQDYQAKCSHTCRKCGLHFQRADEKELLTAATKSGGDLEHYYGK